MVGKINADSIGIFQHFEDRVHHRVVIECRIVVVCSNLPSRLSAERCFLVVGGEFCIRLRIAVVILHVLASQVNYQQGGVGR